MKEFLEKMMAKRLVSLFIFLYLSTTWSFPVEMDQLLLIKSSFSDPLNSLSSWNSSLSVCKWVGVSCDKFSHVSKIELSGKNLSGRIPATIFQLPFVESIDLSDNKLFGEIPSDLSSCLLLKFLNLSNNNFTGQIPRGFRNPLLETFDLSNNMLSGEIPEDIGLFSGLKHLDLGGNILKGGIPKSITNMTNLEFFTLASNQLSGEIPKELGLLKSLQWIYLGYNNFTGGIPKEIGELRFLYHLDLVYNNLTSEIPSSLGNLTNLQFLFLYGNKLNGSIPPTIFTLKNLISLDLSINCLHGEIPEEISMLKNLEILHLFSNNFTGKIPKSLSVLPKLSVLQLWSNKFSGKIPENLGRFNNLTVMDLSSNKLSGKIPESVCYSGRLFKLILFSNSIQGGIPKSLGFCKSLQRVRLQNNRLSGELPPGFTQFPLLNYLDISGNNIFGRIDTLKWSMPELRMLNMARNRFSGKLPDWFGSKKLENLDLSENGFSGNIPKNIGKIPELVELKFSQNKLSGEIPYEISLCKKLVSIDLSHNQLTGKIPASLSDMPVLGFLDLSVNQLIGEIPKRLGNVGSLVQVNVSYNHFHGSLPLTGAFIAINPGAVSGNHLCGGHKISGLPPCRSAKMPLFFWILISFLTAIFVTFALAAFIFFVTKMRKEDLLVLGGLDSFDGKWELRFFDHQASKSISMKDISYSINEKNLICNGNLGALYKGKSSTRNIQFVAKIFSDNNPIMMDINWRNLEEIVPKIHHPNIVKILGACRSGKGGILIFEYVEGTDLSEAIRGSTSWAQRKKVAIGVARALRYLHGCSSATIRVGNIYSRKIIVDNKGEARLRLNLPLLLCIENKCFISSAYAAPESVDSKIITDKTDMYGFGLLLIELLTGKKPTDPRFGVHESIVEWARYCYSDCHLDMWVDPTIKNDAIKNSNNQLVETMFLALNCTANDPAARPCASEVAKALEFIGKSTPVCFRF